MIFRIIELPPFKAASSGVDKTFDFSPEGILGSFAAKCFQTPAPRDAFMPRDFLYYDHENQGMVWLWALSPDLDSCGYETVDFEGGYYLTYAYRDGDEAEGARLHEEAMTFIADSGIFTLDERPGHYTMGHIITPQAIIGRQGWSQMETFVPIKLIDRQEP